MFEISAITNIKFTPKDAEMSISKLSQGELDVLEQLREALQWSSIKSLAVKYYPAHPCRKHWLEALRRARNKCDHVNIIYLLKCILSIEREWREAAFSGKPKLNRIIHNYNKYKERDVTRLVCTSNTPEFANAFMGFMPPLMRRQAASAF